jgi:site-specific DNA-methyltransferase (adenine-specific)
LNYNNGDLAHHRESAFGGDKTKEVARPIAGDGERESYKLFVGFLREAKRILVKGACCCCCCCGGGGGPKPLFARWTLFLDRYIGFKQAVVWDKGGLGMGIHYRRNYEFMLVAQNGSPAYCWNGGNTTPNVLRIPKIIPSEHEHPTEKPVALMEYFINLHSKPGDLILDPFAGTGATLVAAKRTGRRYLGFELNPDYCAIAEKRLAQEVLFAPAMSYPYSEV